MLIILIRYSGSAAKVGPILEICISFIKIHKIELIGKIEGIKQQKYDLVIAYIRETKT